MLTLICSISVLVVCNTELLRVMDDCMECWVSIDINKLITTQSQLQLSSVPTNPAYLWIPTLYNTKKLCWSEKKYWGAPFNMYWLQWNCTTAKYIHMLSSKTFKFYAQLSSDGFVFLHPRSFLWCVWFAVPVFLLYGAIIYYVAQYESWHTFATISIAPAPWYDLWPRGDN